MLVMNCPICDHKYTSLDALRKHINKRHPALFKKLEVLADAFGGGIKTHLAVDKACRVSGQLEIRSGQEFGLSEFSDYESAKLILWAAEILSKHPKTKNIGRHRTRCGASAKDKLPLCFQRCDVERAEENQVRGAL
jgi:hypothetical protein